jgi:hypothetical protein
MWGLDLKYVSQKFGTGKAENLLNNALQFIESKQMEYREGKLILTPGGLLFADGISSSLFFESE